MEWIQNKTRKSGDRCGLPLRAGLGVPSGILFLVVHLLLSHPGRAESAGSALGEAIFSSKADCQDPAYLTGKSSSSGTLLLGVKQFSPSPTATHVAMKISRPAVPPEGLSGCQSLSIDHEAFSRARPPFESPAIIGLVVLFILSLNIESPAQQERLLDLFAFSIAFAAEILKQMVPPKRRWEWTSRPQ